jgi:uncharacterized membrane protein
MNQAPAHDAPACELSNASQANAKLQSMTPDFVDVNADSQSIIVNAPIAEVYGRCFRFEEFPQFLTSITQIYRINGTHFTCTSVIDCREVNSFVTIIMCLPERRIAWQAVCEHFRVGVVLFDPLSDGATKVTVKLRSIVESVKLSGALRRYLGNFKRWLEKSDRVAA